jgi:hypothetical protein
VALDRGSDDVTFQDFDAGHIFIGSSNARVIGGDYGPTVDAVSTITPEVGPNVLIDGARFHDFMHYQGHMECIALYGAHGVTIRRSRFDTCWNFAIFAVRDDDQELRDVLIENNFFSNSGDVPESAHVKVGSHGGACTNFLIRYNTFVDRNVISDCEPATNVRWIANVFERLGGCTEGSSVFSFSVSRTGVPCGTNVVVGDMHFADRSALDLHLTSSSPPIGRGDPHNYPATDIDGNPRPFGSAPDAGADEYGSTGGVRPSPGEPGDGGGAPGGSPADRRAPGLTLHVRRRAALHRLSHRRLRFRARCSEPCRLSARLVARRGAARRLGLGNRLVTLARRTRRLPAGRTVRVRVRLTRRAARAIRNGPPVTLRLRVAAEDAAGNARTVTRRIRMRR